jgi:hypothetical protein
VMPDWRSEAAPKHRYVAAPECRSKAAPEWRSKGALESRFEVGGGGPEPGTTTVEKRPSGGRRVPVRSRARWSASMASGSKYRERSCFDRVTGRTKTPFGYRTSLDDYDSTVPMI